MDDEYDSDDSGGGEGAASGLHYHGSADDKDDFTRAVEEAFPDNDWTPERIEAFKESMRLCFDEYEAEPHEEASHDESPHHGGIDVALVLGGKPKGPTKK